MRVKAIHVGEKIIQKKIVDVFNVKPSFRDPFTIEYMKGKYIVFLPYGVIVLWNISGKDEDNILKEITPAIENIFPKPHSEEVTININRSKDEIFKNGIRLTKLTVEKIAVISMILGRSVALEYVEESVDKVHKEFEEIIDSFAKKGRILFSTRKLLMRIGLSMQIQHTMVSKLAMLDKPDITWEDTHLDQFYNDLSDEYELENRYSILSEKLKIVFHNVDFIVGLISERRSLILEVIIVVLIFIEIVQVTYQIFFS